MKQNVKDAIKILIDSHNDVKLDKFGILTVHGIDNLTSTPKLNVSNAV